MGEPLVVSALKTKRAELAGDIELTARRLQELRATLRRCQRDKGTRGVRARGWDLAGVAVAASPIFAPMG